jgi:nicotinamide mononucleotide transporter
MIDIALEYIAGQWENTSVLEIIAVCFSVSQVLLSYRNSILLYPAGIISCSLFIGLLARPSVGLYAEALLNSYYLIMSIYGWIRWNRRNKLQEQINITRCSSNDWMRVAAICVMAFGLLYACLRYFTDSNVPFLDALVSAFAWAGMWLLANRKLENWILLNLSNIIAIPLLFYKGMPLTALLTVFLFTVAVFGYFRWRKIMNDTTAKTENAITPESVIS